MPCTAMTVLYGHFSTTSTWKCGCTLLLLCWHGSIPVSLDEAGSSCAQADCVPLHGSPRRFTCMRPNNDKVAVCGKLVEMATIAQSLVVNLKSQNESVHGQQHHSETKG